MSLSGNYETAAHCPDADRLSRMLLGALDAPTLENTLSHVDGCTECQLRVENLQESEATDDELSFQLEGLQNYVRVATGGDVATVGNDSLTRTVAPLPELPESFGPYRVEGLIGRGGMGSLYKVTHQDLGRAFALKMLWARPDKRDRLLQRFHRERKAHGQLSHANIVQATDAGVVNGYPYLVTELVDGCDLQRLSRQVGRIDIGTACELIRQAALGLQCAHESGILHRDVKPSNLMLDRKGCVKVVDLGLAAWREDDSSPDAIDQKRQLTEDGQLLGTVDFMSPEQIDAPDSMNVTSDIYSLGCTLYFLLTGKAVFCADESPSVRQILNAHLRQTPPRLVESLGEICDVAGKVQVVLDQMLSKHPKDRLQTMLQVAKALDPMATNHHLDSITASLPELLCTEVQTIPAGKEESTEESALPIGIPGAFAITFLATALGFLVPYFFSANSISNTNVRVSLLSDSLELTTMFSQESPWEPGQRASEMRGLVPRPRNIGSSDWQIHKVSPGGTVRCVRWSPDGASIAVTSSDGCLRMYRFDGRRLILTWMVADSSKDFREFGWTPDGKSLVLVDGQDTIRWIRSADGKEEKSYQVTGGRINSFDVHPQENTVAFIAGDTANIWQQADPKPTPCNGIDVRLLAWARTGESMIVVDGKPTIKRHVYREGGLAPKAVQQSRLRTSSPPLQLERNLATNEIYVWRLRHGDRYSLNSLKFVGSTPSFPASGCNVSGSSKSGSFACSSGGGVGVFKNSKRLHDRQLRGEHSLAVQLDWHPTKNLIAIGGRGLLEICDKQLQTIVAKGAANTITGAVYLNASDQICVGAARGDAAFFGPAGRITKVVASQPEKPDTLQRMDENQATGEVQLSFLSRLHRSTTVVAPGGPFDPPAKVKDHPQAHIQLSELTGFFNKVRVRQAGDAAFETVINDNQGKLGVSISPDGSELMMMDFRGNTEVVSVPGGERLRSFRCTLSGTPRSAVWTEGKITLSVHGAGYIELIAIDPKNGKKIWAERISMKVRDSSASASTVSSAGDQLLHSTPTGFEFRDLETGKLQESYPVGVENGLFCGNHSLSRSKRLAVTWAERPSVGAFAVWDIETWEPIWFGMPVGQGDWITVSAAGKLIDATSQESASKLVWLTRRGGEMDLHDRESFLAHIGK